MQFLAVLKSRPWQMLVPAFALLLVLAVACGSAAAPETDTAAPAPVSTAAPSAPTAVPEAMAEPAEATVNPGKLTIMIGEFANERFDQLYVEGGHGGRTYAGMVGGFLISSNEKVELVPGIASKWGLSDDGLTWSFTIRKGVKFHDGSDVTPQDVLWNLQHYFGAEAAQFTSRSQSLLASRASDRIELVGPDEVNLVTTNPVTQIGQVVSGAVSTWYPIMPERAKLHDAELDAAYDDNPIGAGPLTLIERVPSSVMKFERFDDFYYQPDNGFPQDKRVNFQSLDLFMVPEEATRVAALRAEEVDIAPASLPSRKQIEGAGGRMVFAQEGVAVEVRWMGCWEPQHPCSDKRVRQALDYAIDKELFRDTLYGPEVFQVKGWVGVTPSAIGYAPELDPRPFDPDKARQLLVDAGFPGGEGFAKMIINTWGDTSSPFQVEGAQLAGEFWRKELGLDVEVVVGEETGIKKQWKAGNLNGQVMWRDDEARRDATSWANSAYGNIHTTNRRHEDPVLLSVVEGAVQIVDQAEREAALTKLWPRLKDESYQLGMGYVNIPWAVGPRVLTWDPYPISGWITALHTINLK